MLTAFSKYCDQVPFPAAGIEGNNMYSKSLAVCIASSISFSKSRDYCVYRDRRITAFFFNSIITSSFHQ